jgi:hypothetical protein
MSYQYLYCPACAMRRAAFDYHCSVCGSLVRRPAAPAAHVTHQTLRAWQPIVQASAPVDARQSAEREAVAA